jgi:hypothetical protein
VIEYVTTLDGVEPVDLDGFFVGWPTRPSNESRLEVLRRSELVRRVLAQLDDRYMVDLCCDEELVRFYERFGMRRLVGMARRTPSAIPSS